ncbi:MAG: mechanosensitive ion channel family protein [Motilibacteraceae bacterium]
MPLAVAPLTDVSLWVRSNGLEIVLFVTGAALLTRFAQWTGGKVTARIDANARATDAVVRSEEAKHRHALAQALTWTAIVIIWCVTVVLVLDRLGVPQSGLVAPAAVIGVALGFGAQRVVQDVLAGFFAIAERQYGFGDLIRVSVFGTPAPVSGTVEEVTLRITRIRTADGEVVITPNGQITQVTNLSRNWARAVLDVPVPAAVDVRHASEVLVAVGEDAYRDADLRPLLLDPPTVMGVESIEVDQFQIRMVARTLPGKQFEVGRELRARIAAAFREEGITVPPTLGTATPTGSEA